MGKVIIKKGALRAGWTKSARDVGDHTRTGRRRNWAEVVKALATSPAGHVKVKMGSRNSAYVTRHNLIRDYAALGLEGRVIGNYVHLKLGGK